MITWLICNSPSRPIYLCKLLYPSNPQTLFIQSCIYSTILVLTENNLLRFFSVYGSFLHKHWHWAPKSCLVLLLVPPSIDIGGVNQVLSLRLSHLSLTLEAKVKPCPHACPALHWHWGQKSSLVLALVLPSIDIEGVSQALSLRLSYSSLTLRA